jgi:hypothetical protein
MFRQPSRVASRASSGRICPKAATAATSASAALGRDNGNAVGLGQRLDRRDGELPPAPLGPVRLRDGQDDLVPAFDQALKGGNGEVGRSHEDDSHLRLPTE